MIYVHIPYCRSFCTYCDFYSEIPTCGFGDYVDALCGEIEFRAGEIPWEHDTLYIGGGTPSVLPLPDLRRMVEALRAAKNRAVGETGRRSGGVREGCETGTGTGENEWEEFTVEVNPDDVTRQGAKWAREMAGLGVNRVSMGVQSLDDGVLRWMNRRHNAAQAREAYGILRDAGIENISVDLIFGLGKLPGTDPNADVLSRTVDGILDIGGDGKPPRHISAYQLSVEPGSELARMVADGEYAPATDEDCAGQYELICARLAAAGYDHYEISNFAQPDFESRHNSAYWTHVPYIGLGPAAHSLFIRDGRLIRRWNSPDLKAYIRASATGDWDSVSRGEVLTAEQIREERVMLSLRTSAGIDLNELLSVSEEHDGRQTENGKSGTKRRAMVSKVETMLRRGALVIAGEDRTATKNGSAGPRVRIPESRFFVSDDIISDLI